MANVGVVVWVWVCVWVWMSMWVGLVLVLQMRRGVVLVRDDRRTRRDHVLLMLLVLMSLLPIGDCLCSEERYPRKRERQRSITHSPMHPVSPHTKEERTRITYKYEERVGAQGHRGHETNGFYGEFRAELANMYMHIGRGGATTPQSFFPSSSAACGVRHPRRSPLQDSGQSCSSS